MSGQSGGRYLKTLGVNVFQYLDDWLVVGETYQLALSYRDTVRLVTQRVGFIVNKEKSDWVPSQFLLFLGSSLDLARHLVFPSEDRIDRLQRLIRGILKSPASPARLWRSLFGYLASMIQLVPAARRHISPLQYFVQERWDTSMPQTTPVAFSSAARERFNGGSILRTWCPSSFLGPSPRDYDRHRRLVLRVGRSPGRPKASGIWQPQWKSKHINWLELQAVVVLIALFWPSQIWFRHKTNLLVDLPRAIPDQWNLLKNLETHEFFPEPARLRLTAWRLSADQSLRRDFRKRWPTLPPRDATSLLGGFMVPVLHTSQDGVLREQWTPLYCPCEQISLRISLSCRTKGNLWLILTIVGYRTAITSFHAGFRGGVSVSSQAEGDLRR